MSRVRKATVPRVTLLCLFVLEGWTSGNIQDIVDISRHQRYQQLIENKGEREVVDAVGIEPTTSRLRVECSTS